MSWNPQEPGEPRPEPSGPPSLGQQPGPAQGDAMGRSPASGPPAAGPAPAGPPNYGPPPPAPGPPAPGPPAAGPPPGPWYAQTDYWQANQPAQPPPPWGWQGPPQPAAPPPGGRGKVLILSLVAVVILLVAGTVGVLALAGKKVPTATSSPTPLESPLPSPSPSPTGPPGYTAFSDSADGFSVSLPPGWRQIDIASLGSNQALQQLEAANPGLAAILGGGTWPPSG